MYNTKQKKLIFSVLRSTKTHPTAEWIYKQTRKSMPTISLGTVYRNLSALRHEGRIRSVSFGQSERFDARTSRHSHFVCTLCHSVHDLEPELVTLKYSRGARKWQAATQQSDIMLYGLCAKCRKEKNKRKRSKT